MRLLSIRPTFLAAFATLAPATAQGPELPLSLANAPRTPAPELTPFDLPSTAQRPVLHDAAADGTHTALGHSWKMVFARDGASFVPLLGANAPRLWPLQFRSPNGDDVVSPERRGDRVTYRRAAYDEVYDLATGHVEQSFWFAAPPRPTELRLPVATQLHCAGRSEAGLRFTVDGFGGMTYSDAVAIDARGRRLALPVQWDGDAIVVPLPAAWFRDAAYPVCVDPILQAFNLTGTANQPTSDPTVAYADSVNVFQVSYLIKLANDEHDVVATRFNSNGTLLETIAIDLSNANSRAPAVAFASPHFITAWNEATSIQARARVAGSTALASKFRVSGINFFESRLSIGGGGAGGRCLVAYGDLDLLGRERLATRLVSAAGTEGPVETPYVAGFFAPGQSVVPAVSPKPDASGRWLVAFGNRQDIRGAVIASNGDPVTNVFGIATLTTADELEPAVTTMNNQFFVAWEHRANNTIHIHGRTVTGSPVVLGLSHNLSALEPGGGFGARTAPALGFDGARLIMAYASSTALRAATFFVTTAVSFQEGNVLLDATSNTFIASKSIASAGLDVPGRHMITWTRSTTGSNQVRSAHGVTWTSLANGGVTRLGTGCGGTSGEPFIFSNSVPALGTTCSVLVTPVTALLVAVGTPGVFGACAGTPCQFGVGNATFFTAPASGVVTLPIGTNPSLLGTQLAVQSMDFGPAATAAGAANSCANGVGLRFTLSDTIVFTVQ